LHNKERVCFREGLQWETPWGRDKTGTSVLQGMDNRLTKSFTGLAKAKSETSKMNA
jgi:hypothetical protein